MKNTKSSIAILVMAIVVFVSITVVSCKKESPDSKNEPKVQSFYPGKIENMNEYLMEFKHKIGSTTKSDNENMNIEEATWHLSSLANFDFSNANVTYNNILIDTLYSHINIVRGGVSMDNLGLTYSAISNAIDSYYHSLNLENKHFRYINATISEEGEVTVSMIITYNDDDQYHLWYPSDTVYCDEYFSPETTSYPAQGFGRTELERVLNIIDSRPTEPDQGRVYYVPSRKVGFLFTDYIDPYGAPNFMDSRLFCTQGYFSVDIGQYMCYYLCSYHELGRSVLSDMYTNEDIISWSIQWKIYSNAKPSPLYPQIGYHYLEVQLGYNAYTPNPPGGWEY